MPSSTSHESTIQYNRGSFWKKKGILQFELGVHKFELYYGRLRGVSVLYLTLKSRIDPGIKLMEYNTQVRVLYKMGTVGAINHHTDVIELLPSVQELDSFI